MKILFCPLISTALGLFFLPADQFAAEPSFRSLAQPFLENHCLDCHDEETRKGDLALDGLSGVNVENFGVWKRIWEQVALKEMPPKKTFCTVSWISFSKFSNDDESVSDDIE